MGTALHPPPAGVGEDYFDRGILAAGRDDWEMAAGYFEASLQSGAARGAACHNLGVARWQQARHAEAEALFAAAVESDPDNARYRGQWERLRAWRRHCLHLLGADAILPSGAVGRELSGTPLGLHHAKILSLRQQDPGVLRWARVAPLPSAGVAADWIRCRQDARHGGTLALVHRCHGLIGIASLARSNATADLLYWIGADYRGRGYGSSAVELLVALARRLQVAVLEAAVLEDNHRSRHVLRRAGFAEVRRMRDVGGEWQWQYSLPLPREQPAC